MKRLIACTVLFGISLLWPASDVAADHRHHRHRHHHGYGYRHHGSSYHLSFNVGGYPYGGGYYYPGYSYRSYYAPVPRYGYYGGYYGRSYAYPGYGYAYGAYCW